MPRRLSRASVVRVVRPRWAGGGQQWPSLSREFAPGSSGKTAVITPGKPPGQSKRPQKPLSRRQTRPWVGKSASNCRKPPPNPARAEASHKRVNPDCRALVAGNRPFGRRYRPDRGRIRAAFSRTGDRERLRLGLGRFCRLVQFGRAPRAAGPPGDDRRLSFRPVGDPQGLHPQSPPGSDHRNASPGRARPRRQASRDRAGLAGIRRTYGTRQVAKRALLTEGLRRIVRKLRIDTPGGCRDRALLLVCFGAAMRRSELIALDLDDITITQAWRTLLVRRSKTDQEGQGRAIGIPRSRKSATCPVAALEAWLDLAKSPIDSTYRDDGEQNENAAGQTALFTRVDHGRITGDRLTGRAVAEIVKRAAKRTGIDPSKVAGPMTVDRKAIETVAGRQGRAVKAPTLPLRPRVRAPARERPSEIKDRGRPTRSSAGESIG
jgi:hypothetical protein